MKEEFGKNLIAAQKEEMEALIAYHEMKSAKEAELAAARKALDFVLFGVMVCVFLLRERRRGRRERNEWRPGLFPRSFGASVIFITWPSWIHKRALSKRRWVAAVTTAITIRAPSRAGGTCHGRDKTKQFEGLRLTAYSTMGKESERQREQ